MAAGWKGSGQAQCDSRPSSGWREKSIDGSRGSSARTSGSMVFTVSLAKKRGRSRLREERVGPPARSHEGRARHRASRCEEGLREGAADEAAESEAGDSLSKRGERLSSALSSKNIQVSKSINSKGKNLVDRYQNSGYVLNRKSRVVTSHCLPVRPRLH